MNKNYNKEQYKADKKEQIKNLMIDVENGILNFQNTDEYLKYLKFQSKFHTYSLNNAMLIFKQCPNATYLKGFKAWSDMGRKVNKGAKGIKILAPIMYSREEENEDGEIEKKEHLFFKTVVVFDISQTNGDDSKLPTLVTGLKGDTDKLDLFIKATKEISNIDVEFSNNTDGAKGYFSPLENRIVVRNDIDNIHKVKTIAHELTHSILHKGDFDYKKYRPQAETEAESVAFIVCKYFGIDTDDYSFAYLNSWTKGDIKDLKKSLNNIQKTALKIIETIEELQ